MNDNLNLTMLTDFYEITMANGYFESGMKDDIAYFDMFFRKVPDGGGYAIMAGVEQVIEYLNDLKFTDCDIEYLRDKKMFSEGFLEYLRNFKFACDIWTVLEGIPIFPDEPLLTVREPMIQVIVESVFSWPGLGSYFMSSIINRDTPAITGCMLMLEIGRAHV